MRNLQRIITVGCILIGLLLLVGIVSAFFSPGIQAALTVPAAGRKAPTAAIMPAASPFRPTAPSLKMTMTTLGPSPTTAAAMILAQDTFRRGNQILWGTASDGQRWGTNANSVQNFSIAGQTGIIANGPGAFDATLGPRVSDAGVVFSGSLNLFSPAAANAPNMGAILRWSDTNNWYKAYIDGARLILLKKVAGQITSLDSTSFPAQNGQSYSLRFRISGSMLMARAWPTGQAEPAAWLVTAQDMSLTSGFGGLRVVLQSGSIARISMFTETP